MEKAKSVQEHMSKDTLLRAIKECGCEHQIDIAIEELSELTKELCKSKRGYTHKNHIAEEMADVLIMLEQLKIIYGISNSEIKHWIDHKMNRLSKRIDEKKAR